MDTKETPKRPKPITPSPFKVPLTGKQAGEVATVMELEEETFPAAALESVTLGLPREFETEIFAAELLDNLAAYHKSAMGARAARHQGDHQTAERLARQAALCKTAAALIQHEHPETVGVYQEMASLRAHTLRQERARLAVETVRRSPGLDREVNGHA